MNIPELKKELERLIQEIIDRETRDFEIDLYYTGLISAYKKVLLLLEQIKPIEEVKK